MDVSIVIPTHGRPDLLAMAMESVRHQTFRPVELIIVDDMADDQTRRAVTAFANTCAFPVHYVRNTAAKGACGSRNLGAFHSGGEWIAFLDDDDVWSPHFLERVMGQAGQGDVDLVMSALLRQERGRSDTVRITPDGMTGENVLRYRSAMTGSNFLIRAESFCAVRGFDPDMPVFNDWDMLVRLLRKDIRYAVVKEPLVEWRDHGGERIATPSIRRADGIDRFLERYGNDLAPAMRRELQTTALGIRRKYARKPLRYLELSVALAVAHGPIASLARLMRMRPPVAAS
ncbi:MAG: glycosyltransferase family 2 protein [Sphingobium sp.]